MLLVIGFCVTLFEINKKTIQNYIDQSPNIDIQVNYNESFLEDLNNHFLLSFIVFYISLY